MLSVERLDYAKAPVQKVEAIAALLGRRPELRGRLRFRLVCPPPEAGITSYDTTRQLLERRISEVNRAWGGGGWQPIEYLPRSLPFTEVIDHYLAADVFWVTSLQDGMNLTAKEFVAAQRAANRSGVLVLSRHTGAASQLGTAALLTDPHSPADLVDTLHQALTLAPEERRIRLERLADLLGHHHLADWAADITTAIRSHGDPRRGPQDPDRSHSSDTDAPAAGRFPVGGRGGRLRGARQGPGMGTHVLASSCGARVSRPAVTGPAGRLRCTHGNDLVDRGLFGVFLANHFNHGLVAGRRSSCCRCLP
ncbi:trehalose-6-phosphate synthase [Kitasatospora sp. NPDC058218]|uniref:trehalose-6-phosphate synthase n=1 Tax=Kitasatospora sp. NPDC058218 TaxID=3346385 RepID=UPI0036DBB200